jgi:hypothetical protein
VLVYGARISHHLLEEVEVVLSWVNSQYVGIWAFSSYIIENVGAFETNFEGSGNKGRSRF